MHWAGDWVADAGAIGPDDERGQRFGYLGPGACLAYPQGAIFNERYIHIGAGTIVGPHASLSAGMAPGQEMVTDPVCEVTSTLILSETWRSRWTAGVISMTTPTSVYVNCVCTPMPAVIPVAAPAE